MAWYYCNKFKFKFMWPVLLGVTLIGSSLLIYKIILNYENPSISRSDFENLSLKKAAKLTDKECKSVCQTEDCVDIAYEIMRYMNMSVDPCDDFYKYACGNYHALHGDETNTYVFLFLENTLQLTIKDIIETSPETQYPESAAEKLKIVYDSCMDTGNSEVASIESLKSFLNDIGIKNWPNLDANFEFSNPTLGDAIGMLQTFNLNFFARFENTSFGLEVMIYETSFPPDCIDGLKNILAEVLKFAGMSEEDSYASLETFVQVENKISEIAEKTIEDAEWCQEMPRISLNCSSRNSRNRMLLCETADSLIKFGDLPSHLTTDGMFASCEEAFKVKELFRFLQNYNQRDLARYISLKVIQYYLPYLNFSLRRKWKTFYDKCYYWKITSTEPIEDGWRFCVSYIKKSLKEPLGMMYVAEMFSQEAIDELDALVQESRQMIRQLVLAQDAIPQSAKEMVIKEVENVMHVVDVIKSLENGTNFSVPHESVINDKNRIMDAFKLFQKKEKINKAYEVFHPLKTDFLFNVMQQNKLNFYLTFNEPFALDEDVSGLRLERLMTARPWNEDGINLPFGILLAPFHKHEYPKLFKIAHLAEVISHEIGHSVYMVLKMNSMGDDETRRFMDENTGCRNAQYSKFEYENVGQKINANNTENEDFADNVGAQVTEKLLETWLSNKQERMFALPGIDLTSEQIFYILYAQSNCQTRDIKEDWKAVEDVHSPSEFRVQGVFQNSKRFSQVFSCPENSKMNPPKKCPVFN